MAMHINCTKMCASCCLSHRFALGGKHGISLVVHVTMCCHMFGPLLMPQALPCVMIVKMMIGKFVRCVITNTQQQFAGNAMRSVELNVLTFKLVGMKRCISHHNSVIFVDTSDLSMLQYTQYYFLLTQS